MKQILIILTLALAGCNITPDCVAPKVTGTYFLEDGRLRVDTYNRYGGTLLVNGIDIGMLCKRDGSEYYGWSGDVNANTHIYYDWVDRSCGRGISTYEKVWP